MDRCKENIFEPTHLLPLHLLVEQQLLTLPEHMSSTPVFSGVPVIHFDQIHVFSILVQCDISNDIRIKTKLGSYYLSFVSFNVYLCFFYLRVLLSNSISISDDIHIVYK
jgi:hypothetical protein